MAILNICNYKKNDYYKRMRGAYQNIKAVENVLRYVMRVRNKEDRRNELIASGGWGISLYSIPEQIITEFLYVQQIYRIDVRKGRRMYHEVLNFSNIESYYLLDRPDLLYEIALKCSRLYFEAGYQVVFAIHWDKVKHLHIHFAVNSINFRDGRKWHTGIEEVKMRELYFQSIIKQYCDSVMRQKNVVAPIEFEV